MLKYVGKSFIIGVPARDLSDEEVTHFNKKRLLDSGLYKEVRVSKKKYQENVKRSDYESEED